MYRQIARRLHLRALIHHNPPHDFFGLGRCWCFLKQQRPKAKNSESVDAWALLHAVGGCRDGMGTGWRAERRTVKVEIFKNTTEAKPGWRWRGAKVGGDF